MAWMAANCTVRENQNENIVLAERKSAEASMATFIALSRAMAVPNGTGSEPVAVLYDSSGAVTHIGVACQSPCHRAV